MPKGLPCTQASLSLMKICAQRKTGKRKRARRTSPCFFSMVPCSSSPVTRVLRSPLRLSRSQCQGIEVKTTVMRSLPHSRFCLEIKTAERETVGYKTLKKSASCGEKWLEYEKFLKWSWIFVFFFLFFFTSVRVFFFSPWRSLKNKELIKAKEITPSSKMENY